MKGLKLHGLRQLSKYMKEVVIAKGYPFDMRAYVGVDVGSDEQEFIDFVSGDNLSSGVPACLLGWAIHAFNMSSKEVINGFERFGERKFQWNFAMNNFGLDSSSECYSINFLLFDTRWGNDVQFAVERLDYVIECKGNMPHVLNDELDASMSMEEIRRLGD